MDKGLPQSQGYERILVEHRELKSLLGQIDQGLRERTGTVEEMGSLLGQLGDRLVKHFAMEEDGGYFGDVLLHAPQLVAKANQLLAQHPKMCAHATQILVEIQGSSPPENWWEKTQRLFLAFRQELLLHEREEDRLLQEAYGQDIGSHD